MNGKQRLNVAQLWELVADFNRDYPVGSLVSLRTDDGYCVTTTVTHAAQVLGDHSAVAWFRGISGCYSIEDGRVEGLG